MDNGLAKTPPLGWNSWNKFQGNIDETTIKQIADAMVSSGMKDAGYTYINLDDNWMANPARDANGNLQGDPTRFPSGMKALGDYIHSKGLKFGIYGCRGTRTCMGIPQSGSYQHEVQDAQTFASWGVDYLKYDNCYAVANEQADYERMRDALANCGRPIVFSLCAWHYADWMPATGNLYRTGSDIIDAWDKGQSGIVNIIDNNSQFAGAAGPGHWNDPDMLEVGNGGCTLDEYRSHMSMWCMMAAPLIVGNDLRSMSTDIINILTNKEVIAVDQDPAGVQGYKVSNIAGLEVWCKPLGYDGTTKAIALFNRGKAAAQITVSFANVGLKGSVAVRDLWAEKDQGVFTNSYTALVPSHGTVMLKIVGTPGASLLNGTYKVINVNSGLALDVPGDTKDDVQLIQWSYHSGDNQKWSFIPYPDGTYRIKNVSSNKSIDLYQGLYTNNAIIGQFTDNAGDNQKWILMDVGNGRYAITSCRTGKALVVEKAAMNQNAKIIQYKYNATHNDEWLIQLP